MSEFLIGRFHSNSFSDLRYAKKFSSHTKKEVKTEKAPSCLSKIDRR